MPAVRVDEVEKRFGKPPRVVEALKGVSFQIERGEIFGLLGPNGAGKTTLIKILSTLLDADSGRATVAGVNVAQDPAGVRARIGLVFQEPSLDNLLTGRENLLLSASLYNLARKEANERIGRLLEVMDLTARGDDRVDTYSGGMKRRLEIARGLLHDPQVLFLDEPTLGLDPQTRERLWTYIRGLREQGTTVLMTTHYMDEADALCDRIAIIDRGEIQALDSPENLKQRLGDTVVYLRGQELEIEAIRATGGVAEADAIENEPHTYSVRLDTGVRGLPEFLRQIQGVDGIEVRTPTLQDVFLDLTGRELRDAEEGGAGFAEDYQRLQQAGGG